MTAEVGLSDLKLIANRIEGELEDDASEELLNLYWELGNQKSIMVKLAKRLMHYQETEQCTCGTGECNYHSNMFLIKLALEGAAS